jgi:hypothetical protein
MKAERGSKDDSSATPRRRDGEPKGSELKVLAVPFPVNHSANSLIFARKYDLAPPQFKAGLKNVTFKPYSEYLRETLESFSDTFATVAA